MEQKLGILSSRVEIKISFDPGAGLWWFAAQEAEEAELQGEAGRRHAQQRGRSPVTMVQDAMRLVNTESWAVARIG